MFILLKQLVYVATVSSALHFHIYSNYKGFSIHYLLGCTM